MSRTLQQKCDTAYSLLRRHQAKDKEGNVKCYTCPTKRLYTHMTIGHYMKRRHIGTRYNDVNCKPQCMSCQTICESHSSANNLFRYNLVKEHGEEKVSEIEQLAHSTHRMSKVDYQELLDELNRELKKYGNNTNDREA